MLTPQAANESVPPLEKSKGSRSGAEGGCLVSDQPKGQLTHAAGPSPGGWTIVVVYDSRENWEQFRDGVLVPKMKQGIKGGFATPPQETGFEVYNLQP